MKLNEISYPVYKLGLEEPLIEESLVLYRYMYQDEDTAEITITEYIVDDRSISKDTLAARRLVLLSKGVKLRKINVGIYFLGDLIKLAKPDVWFIDSSGKCFRYKKQKLIKLTFNKITKILPLKGMGAIIEIENIPSRFKTLFTPTEAHKYAGVLRDGASNILYGLYEMKHTDTRRMV